MQPNPELVDQVEPLSCLTGLFHQANSHSLVEAAECTFLGSQVWCTTTTGDSGLEGAQQWLLATA